MISKERVARALSRQQPDRVPVYADFVPGIHQKLKEKLGIQSEPELSIALGNDMLLTGHGLGTNNYTTTKTLKIYA